MNKEKVVEGLFYKDGKQYMILRGSDSPQSVSEEDLSHLDQWNSLRTEFEHKTGGENTMAFDYGPSMGGVIESILF